MQNLAGIFNKLESFKTFEIPIESCPKLTLNDTASYIIVSMISSCCYLHTVMTGEYRMHYVSMSNYRKIFKIVKLAKHCQNTQK